MMSQSDHNQPPRSAAFNEQPFRPPVRVAGPRVNRRAVEDAVRLLLVAVGEDIDRPGLRETPARVARFWSEFVDHDPGTTDTTFEQRVTNQLVAVSGMRIWSLCEHHLLPFNTNVAIGYIADGKVLGLSKFARIARQFGSRLQTQEQLAEQIADEVQRVTGARSVAVLCDQGLHTCMVMRGVRQPGAMANAVLRGVFMEKFEARAEFYRLVKG